MTTDVTILTTRREVVDNVLQFYASLFRFEKLVQVVVLEVFFQGALVYSDENILLKRHFTTVEIKEVVFSMNDFNP